VFELVFHSEVMTDVRSLEKTLQAKVVLSFDKLREQGNKLRYPHTRLISNGLFELRVGSKDIARTFFVFSKGNRIYILRTFLKKTQKTPEAEINLALKRLKEMMDEQ